MIKSLTLAIVLASAIAGITSVPANAAKFGRTTASDCQALYNLSLRDSKSDRSNRDDYISCIGRL
jgi:hypothetical protein